MIYLYSYLLSILYYTINTAERLFATDLKYGKRVKGIDEK